jgi:hypothetical protein
MNTKFVISAVAVFVVAMLLGFLVHGLLLHKEYAQLPNLMRSEEASMKLFGLMVIAHIIYAIGFTWIYMRGREAKPWLGQGARFGLAVAVLAVIPMYLIYYVIMPFPSDLVAQQIVYDTIATVILGIVVAWINR